MCVCRQGRPVLLQLSHLCYHPAGRGKHPSPHSRTCWTQLLDIMGWEEDAQLLAVHRLEGSSCKSCSEEIQVCSLRQMRKRLVGGDGGQAGLSPALIPCSPLTLPSHGTDTQLEMSMWAVYCPLSRGGG